MKLRFAIVLLGSCGRGPMVPKGLDPIAKNEKCTSCHSEIATEWRKSMHRASYDDPIFLASYAREPARFCIDCHAPEDKSGEGRKTPLASLGTACTTCHPSSHEEKKIASVHPCGGCHEFSFPGRERSAKLEDRMQRTLAEHGTSELSSVACTSCHMPVVNGHKSHVFGGGNDPAWLRTALDVRAKREDDKLILTLTPGQVGHAVPTGNLFRRILVSAENEKGVTDSKPLGRVFALEKGERIEIADTRPGSNGPQRVELHVGPGRVRWFIDYQRVLGQTPGDTEIAQSLRVMEGIVE